VRARKRKRGRDDERKKGREEEGQRGRAALSWWGGAIQVHGATIKDYHKDKYTGRRDGRTAATLEAHQAA
jgi:hypothetical protein